MDDVFDKDYAKSLVTAALNEEIERLYQLQTLKNHIENSNSVEWTQIKKIDSIHPGMNKPGVYAIIHLPSNKVAYYGISNAMNSRVKTHIKGFKNTDGVIDSTKDSQAAKKMYEHDPDLENWGVRFLPTELLRIARHLEESYGLEHPSLFNNLSMLGV
jgi:hypothetical protein